jgi:hypothetical protein
VIEFVSGKEIRFVYVGELYPGEGVPLVSFPKEAGQYLTLILLKFPSYLVEGDWGTNLTETSSVESPRVGLAMRRGLRFQVDPERPFRYPSLQLSFPHLFPRLATSGWTHSFLQNRELSGEDLQLGDVLYFEPNGRGIQIIGNFHDEISLVSEVYRYVEPNVSDFQLDPEAVK